VLAQEIVEDLQAALDQLAQIAADLARGGEEKADAAEATSGRAE
jgi:hypothetical protein